MDIKVRIGIMGGTFDPIHNGHLVIAQEVLEQFKLDKILFIPNGNPSHKKSIHISSKKNRFHMTKLAILDNPHFFISDIEYKNDRPSYSYDTICSLKHTFADSEFYFIVGDDSILDILNWYKSTELINLCKFIVVNRPNFNNEAVSTQIKFLEDNFNASILRIDHLGFDISSTEIRHRIYSNKSVQYLVPPSVEAYIRKKELYYNKLTISKSEQKHIEEIVASAMGAKRFSHTLGVTEFGVKLAQHHGVDANKAYLGCIYHDLAKEMDHTAEYPIEFDAFETAHPQLKHGKIAAFLVEHSYNITDPDILDSIRYHTIGRHNMSNLEKIVYLADMCEYGRGSSDSYTILRKLCFQDLDRAMYYSMKIVRHSVVHEKQKELHPSLNGLIEEYEKYN